MGLIFSFISCKWMSTFNLQTPDILMIWTGIIQGIGMGLFFVPVSMLALSTLNSRQIGEASGLFSLGRSIGSSVGISLISMVATRQTQINWHSLVKYISHFNSNLQLFLASQNLSITSPVVLKLLANKVLLQANFNAFMDCFLLSSYGFLTLIIFIVFIEVPATNKLDKSM